MGINSYLLNELSVGMQDSIGHVVTIDEFKRFSTLVSDYHPLHYDENYAIANGFDGVIAQGFLISSFASSLVSMKLPGKNALIVSNKFRYLKPVYPNDHVIINGEISNIEKRFSFATIEINAYVNAVKVCEGEIMIKVRN